MNNDCLFDSQHAQGFDFLIEGLQQWGRRFRMQDCARMRLKGYDSWNGRGARARSTTVFMIELMPEMQTVKDAERQDSRRGQCRRSRFREKDASWNWIIGSLNH